MKYFIRIFFTFLFLLAFFTLFVIASHLIPSSAISNNTAQSAKVLQQEGLYPKFLNFKLFQMDNFTDAYMLYLSLSADSSNPVESAMMNYFYSSEDFHDHSYYKLAIDIENLALNQSEHFDKESYGRYWHGYQVFLRPILTVFNYSQIRIINYILFSILLIACTRLIYKKIGNAIAALFIFSLILINFPIVPLSMQFSTVFYIAFVAIILILTKRKILEKKENVFCFFFIIGAVTSYFDFLTAPLIALGLPLIIYQLSIQDNDNKYLTTIRLSVLWGFGYALLWASKWVIAYVLTDINPFADVMQAAEMRSSNLYKGMEMTIPKVFTFIWESASDAHLAWLFYGTIVLLVGFLIIYFARLLKNKNIFWKYGWLLLIAASVPAWYLLLRNHSIQHFWFTWRALLVSLFSGLIFLYHTVEWKKLKIR